MTDFPTTLLERETVAETAEYSHEHVAVDGPVSAEADRYISFTLGQIECCIDIDFVAEVTGQLTSTFLPNTPAAIAGIAPHRGEMIAIVGVRQLLDQGQPAPGSRPKFVILNQGSPTARVAFEVDRIRETMEAAESDFLRNDAAGISDAYLDLPHSRIFRIDPVAVYAALG